MDIGGNTIMNVHLPDHWGQFIRSQVQSGRYSSEAEVLEEALRLLQQRDQEKPGAVEPADNEGEKTPHKPIWEVFQEIAASIPDEEWANLPVDGAEQHDHYIYGTPKRPPS
jgi:putative addiction module CopG family antidote